MEALSDCPKCGREVRASDQECERCGAWLGEPSYFAHPPRHRQEKPRHRREKRPNAYLGIFDAPLLRDQALTVGILFGAYALAVGVKDNAVGNAYAMSYPEIALEVAVWVVVFSVGTAVARRIARAIRRH